jgi:hypothetical protein
VSYIAMALSVLPKNRISKTVSELLKIPVAKKPVSNPKGSFQI